MAGVTIALCGPALAADPIVVSVGFGDPLDRELARVANDVGNGWVGIACARESCGVALTPDDRIDEAATLALRESIRNARKQRPTGAGPWMALRYKGDAPHFVLEEISCPACATLLSVREVLRADT